MVRIIINAFDKNREIIFILIYFRNVIYVRIFR